MENNDSPVNLSACLHGVSSTIWLIVLFTVMFLVVHAKIYWMNVDDAFISFRYAENFSKGLGLVFNDGEYVEGYTNFLWVMLLSIFRVTGADIPGTAQILGALFAAACIPVLFISGIRCYGLPPWIALLPCIILAFSAPVAMWAASGLETSLYMTLFTLSLALMHDDLRSGRTRPLSGVFFGIAALTRPEAAGLFIFCVFYCFVCRVSTIKNLGKMLAGFMLVFLPHLIFRIMYYGYIFPNTFYAKTGFDSGMLYDGLGYVSDFLFSHGIWGLLGLILYARSRRKQENHFLWALPPAVTAVALVYVISVGGDIYPYSRFCIPYLPWIALLICTGTWRQGLQWAADTPKLKSVIPPAMVLIITISMIIPGKLWSDARYRDAYEKDLRGTAHLMKRYGEWLAENYSANTVIAISSLGRIPYYCGFKTIDMLGLADTHIAHRKMKLERGFLGHQKYDSVYILERKPDLVILEFGTKDSQFNPARDTHTEKIYQRILPEKGWWPAPSDLIARKEFRLTYAPRAVEIQSGTFFFLFERDLSLIKLQQQGPETVSDPKKLFELAMLYRKHGLLDEAISTLRRVVILDPDAPNPKFNIAFFMHEDQRFQEALNEFYNLQKIYPDDPRVSYGIALSLQKMKRFADAIPHWEHYIHMASPKDPFFKKAHTFLVEAKHKKNYQQFHVTDSPEFIPDK